jgi:hypothetical protein
VALVEKAGSTPRRMALATKGGAGKAVKFAANNMP